MFTTNLYGFNFQVGILVYQFYIGLLIVSVVIGFKGYGVLFKKPISIQVLRSRLIGLFPPGHRLPYKAA